MKKLTITASDDQVGTIIDALRGAYRSLTIEDAAERVPPPQKPQRNPRKARGDDAILALSSKGTISYFDAQAALIDAGLSIASLSSILSRMTKRGHIERAGNDTIRFLPK